jgi:hypothetical protein
VAEGRLDEALAQVERLEEERHDDAHRLRTVLRDCLPSPHRLTLSGPGGPIHLISEQDVEVGREPGLAIVLGDGTVSRRHLSLRLLDDGLLVTNLSSQGNTHIDDRVLSAAEVITGPSTLALGTRCTLRVTLTDEGAWHLQPAIGDLPGAVHYLGSRCRVREIEFNARERWWVAEERVLAVGMKVGPYEIEA